MEINLADNEPGRVCVELRHGKYSSVLSRHNNSATPPFIALKPFQLTHFTKSLMMRSHGRNGHATATLEFDGIPDADFVVGVPVIDVGIVDLAVGMLAAEQVL
jgi:hypothetical protein